MTFKEITGTVTALSETVKGLASTITELQSSLVTLDEGLSKRLTSLEHRVIESNHTIVHDIAAVKEIVIQRLLHDNRILRERVSMLETRMVDCERQIKIH